MSLHQCVFVPTVVVTLALGLFVKKQGQDSQRPRRIMHSTVKLITLVAMLTLLLIRNCLAEVIRSSNSNTVGLRAVMNETSQIQVPNHYTGTHAIFLISFGEEAADSTLVERCVISLRRRGQWTGYIVMLTDAPPSRYEHWSEENNVIVMHPREEHFNGADGKQLEFNRHTLSLKAKRFKTYILDYIEMDMRLNDIEVIYYLDIDIIAGDSLEHLFRSKQHMIESPPQLRGGEGVLSTLHFFTPISSEYPFQSGTFVVNRSSSRHCLELWRREIEKIAKGTVGMDQAALRTVNEQIKAGSETKCRLIRMDNEDFLSFPKPRNFDEISNSSAYATLIHLSNSKFAKFIDEQQQNEFLHAVLQLSEDEIESGKYGKSIIRLS